MKKVNRRIWLFLSVLGFITLACADLTVVNLTPMPMRVMIKLPDGNGVDTQLVQKDSSLTYYSDSEGLYTVSAIIDDKYKVKMIEARSELQDLLVDPNFIANTNKPVSFYIRAMVALDQTLLNSQQVSCSGNLVEDTETSVGIHYDKNTNRYTITCP